MWVLIAGYDATGKTTVAELLAHDGFELMPTLPTEEPPGIEREFDYFAQRLANQIEAQKIASRKNICTIRSVWESAEVFSRLAVLKYEITEEEQYLLLRTYATVAPQLEPPSVVVWLGSSKKMTMMDRMLLKGETPDEERLRAQVKLYDLLKERIAVPMIELDASETPEQMKNTLEFGVASIRSAQLGNQTLWKRRFLR